MECHLRHRHPDEFPNARNAGRVHREEKVITWKHDSGVGGEGHGVGGSGCLVGVERNAALVRVDSMGGCSDSDQGPCSDGNVGGGCQGSADGNLAWRVGDDWACGTAAVGVEEVRWAPDLGIIMIGCAGTAKTTSATQDCTVSHENGGRVVVAGNGVSGNFGESGGDWVPEFGLKLGGGVREGHSVDLASSDENLASWQNHSVGEDALIPHGVDVLDGDDAVRSVESDDMGIGSRVDTLIAGSTTNHKDFALGSVIHNRVTAHGIVVIASDTGGCLASGTSSAVPVHSSARTSLEDIPILPAEEHSVVVRAVYTLSIVGKHGSDWGAAERSPGICSRAEKFSILSSKPTSPRTTNHENVAVGKSGLRRIPTRSVHLCISCPGIIGRAIDRGFIVSVATCCNETAGSISGKTFAEHVVVRVGNIPLRNSARGRVIGSCDRVTTGAATESAGGIGRPDQNVTTAVVETHGNWHEGEVNGRTPLSETVRRCRGRCLENIEACTACPGATVSSFSLGGEFHVASSGRLENGGLGHIVVCVGTKSNWRTISDSIRAQLDHVLAHVAVA